MLNILFPLNSKLCWSIGIVCCCRHGCRALYLCTWNSTLTNAKKQSHQICCDHHKIIIIVISVFWWVHTATHNKNNILFLFRLNTKPAETWYDLTGTWGIFFCYWNIYLSWCFFYCSDFVFSHRFFVQTKQNAKKSTCFVLACCLSNRFMVSCTHTRILIY